MADELLKWLNEREDVKKAREVFNNEIFQKTHEYQKKYNFEWDTGEGPSHNNESDAFKHAYMQAVLYYRANKKAGNIAGNFVSKTIGDFHENETTGQPLNERNMDLWNNEVGREIAKDVIKKFGSAANKLPENYIENLFALEIIKKMKKGELITNPNDIRKFEDRHKYTHTIRDAKKSYIKKSEQKDNNNQNGHWVTVNGNHVFIENEK